MVSLLILRWKLLVVSWSNRAQISIQIIYLTTTVPERARTQRNESIFLPLMQICYATNAIVFQICIKPISCLFIGLGLLLLRDHWAIDLGFMTLVPWRLFFLLCAVPSLLCTLMLLITPESPKFLLIRGNKAASVKVLQKVASINAGTFPPRDFVVSLVYFGPYSRRHLPYRGFSNMSVGILICDC